MAVTPNDLQALMAGLLEKTASRIKAVEEEKKYKKEDKKSEKPVKGTGDCYGSKVAQTLDYIASNLDTVLSDSQARLGKVAETISVQNEPAKTKTHDSDGKKINWKIDSMATGKDPADPATKTKDDQVPNQGINDLNKPNGGNEKVDPSNPPLFNKSAALDRILAELSKDGTKEAEEVGVPNQLKIVPTETSLGKQEGEDSGGSHGNNLRHLVTSNESAMNYTKRDAKRNYIKQQVGEVFDEGTNVEADTAVQRAFNHGTETSKIAMGNLGLGGLAKGTMGQVIKENPVKAGLIAGAGGLGLANKITKEAAHILKDLVSKEAGLEDVKKMEKLVDKEKKEEKKEEEVSPGIHKKIEKEAFTLREIGAGAAGLAAGGTGGYYLGKKKGKEESKIEKAAFLLRKLAEEGLPPQAAGGQAPPQGMPQAQPEMALPEDPAEIDALMLKLQEMLEALEMKKMEMAGAEQGAPNPQAQAVPAQAPMASPAAPQGGGLA